jgi:hypothetical protein
MSARVTVICSACGVAFTRRRSTGRLCSSRCRKAAQRARDRGIPIGIAATCPSVAPDAFLSVTGTIGISEEQKTQRVTLRQSRKPPTLHPRVVPDQKWQGMYRIKRRDGSLTDMMSLTRAKAALL